MSEDLTTKLPQSADEKLTLILITVQSVTGRVDKLAQRLDDGLEPLLNDVDEIKMSIRDIYGRLDVLTESTIVAQIRNRDVERRVKALGLNTNLPNTET